MKTSTMMTSAMPRAPVGKAWEEVSASFDRFCLAAGIETLGAMMEADAEVACGPRHSRSEDRRGHRWGRTQGKIGFHAGKVVIERPRVRGLNGKELPLESWEQAVDEDWLGAWAMNLMLINVSTRKFRNAEHGTGAHLSCGSAQRVFRVILNISYMDDVAFKRSSPSDCAPTRFELDPFVIYVTDVGREPMARGMFVDRAFQAMDRRHFGVAQPRRDSTNVSSTACRSNR